MTITKPISRWFHHITEDSFKALANCGRRQIEGYMEIWHIEK